MLYFLVFIVATIGLTNIIVESEIFNVPKIWLSKKSDKIQQNIDLEKATTFQVYFKKFLDKLLYMSRCYQCSGFWSGFSISVLALSFNVLVNNFCFVQILISSVICGWAGSLLGMVGYYFMGLLIKWNRQDS